MRILLFVLALVSSGAFADNFRWSFVANVNEARPADGYVGGSAAEACRRGLDTYSSALGFTYSGVDNSKRGDLQYNCSARFFKNGDDYWGGLYNVGYVVRAGDVCPANTELSADGASCDPVSACKALAGQNFAWGYKTPVGYVTNGGKHGIGGYINKDGCEADPGNFNCDAASDGSDYGYCRGIGTYTGLNATSTDTNVGATAIGNDPGKGENTNCGTGMVWSGTTCVKDPNATPTDPGTGGGTGGGTGTGDGTGSGDTGSGGSGGGSGGGGSSGGGTGGDGNGGTGTGGDGNGGTGTGDGKDDGDKDDGDKDGSKVSGEACTASLACTGDAIQCAILRQQRMQQCQTAEWNDYSKAKETINSAIAGKEYDLKESKVDVSGGFDTGTRFLGSTCPTPKSYHSNSFGRTFQLDYAPACQYATAISFLVLAMASLFFIVYVGRSFGGD